MRFVNDKRVTFTLAMCFDAPLTVWSLLVAFNSSLPTCRTTGPGLLYYLAMIDFLVRACLQRHAAVVVVLLDTCRTEVRWSLWGRISYIWSFRVYDQGQENTMIWNHSIYRHLQD